jgi:hypothetical protein
LTPFQFSPHLAALLAPRYISRKSSVNKLYDQM